MELVTDTIQRYRQLYSEDPEVVVIAPGRVNLIGEHTDYNNGYVLPVAIDRNIIIAAGPRADEMLCLHSVDYQESVRIPLSKNIADERQFWSNYPRGVAHVLHNAGLRIKGVNMCIRGNIPIAAGLSSSGALEVASAIAFNFLYTLKLPAIELIKYSQKAETEYVRVLCGIMDQYVSVMGKKDHVLFLDCRSLDSEYVQFPEGVQLIICDTGVRRELAHSEYNQRREECNEAVRQLAKFKEGIQSLRDISLDEFQEYEPHISPVQRRRAKHVISENDRVLRGVDALKRNDMKEFGRHMFDSHRSLKDLYEVSSNELDVVVDIASESDGVYGARMTGAGFGGSAICLVAEEKIDELVQRLRIEYPKRVGRSLTIYLSSPENGATVQFPRLSDASILFTELLQ